MPVEGRDLSSRQTHDVVRDLEIGQPINAEECSETAEGVARESEGRSRLSFLRPDTPAQRFWAYHFAQFAQIVSAFPDMAVRSACALSFSRLARRSLALRPAHSRCH